MDLQIHWKNLWKRHFPMMGKSLEKIDGFSKETNDGTNLWKNKNTHFDGNILAKPCQGTNYTGPQKCKNDDAAAAP